MHFNWNNTFGRVLASSVAAWLVAASTSLYAIPKGPCDPKPPEVCCEEPKPGPFAFAYPMDMNLTCPRDFYVRVDGLAFQAKQDGMDFVIASAFPAGDGIINGRVEGFSNDHADWHYNPGIRFGLGFYLNHDAWNLDFCWTWLNITEYKRINSSTGTGYLVPLWAAGSSSLAETLGRGASAVWNASYNTLDARLGKPYHVSRYLIFHPHFGFRAGWIDQHFSADYGGTAPGNRAIHHGDNDFWGIGTRAGIDTDWMLGKGWKLFGNIAASMLFGKFEIDQNLTQPDSAANSFGIDFDYYQNTPNFEIALGIGWSRYFNKGKYHIAIDAAYEFHEWFDQLNMKKFSSQANGAWAVDTVSRGNLTLNGFSLSVQLDI